jgi:hypothetical protein
VRVKCEGNPLSGLMERGLRGAPPPRDALTIVDLI